MPKPFNCHPSLSPVGNLALDLARERRRQCGCIKTSRSTTRYMRELAEEYPSLTHTYLGSYQGIVFTREEGAMKLEVWRHLCRICFFAEHSRRTCYNARIWRPLGKSKNSKWNKSQIIHTLTTMKSDKVLVILMSAMTWAMADMSDDLYQVHSSCSERGNTPWTRVKPHQLRSWLGSIVPGKVKQ